MSRNSIIILLATLFLIGSAFYSYTEQKSYIKTVKVVNKEKSEIQNVASLQKLWGAKGMISKINRVIQTIPNNKKNGVKVSRSKAILSFVNLTDKELNKLLSNLAKLPVQFKTLNIVRSGEAYKMECLCVW